MNKTINNKLLLLQKLKAPTPKIFRILRNIGLALAAGSAVILTTPLALPIIVTQVAGFMALAGAVASAVSKTAANPEVDLPVQSGEADVLNNSEK